MIHHSSGNHTKLRSLIINGLIILSGLFGVLGEATIAYGAPTCTASTGPNIIVVPLQISNIAVPRDMPNGTIIYRQSINAQATPITCSAFLAFSYYTPHTISSSTSRSSWNTGPYAGMVLNTGVAGIGLAFNINGAPVSLSGETGVNYMCAARSSCIINAQADPIEIFLIKTGNVSAGTLQASSLGILISGTTHVSGGVGVSIGETTYNSLQLSFGGAVNMVSRTCVTPDIQVNMGTHKVLEFSGVNTFTGWTPFNIVLRNCPAFQAGNSLQYRIDATNNLTEANRLKGILSINTSPKGAPQTASGVGIQIGYGAGTPLPLAAFRASGLPLKSQEGASYSIPLMARYIQTNSEVGAGSANATATFTLSYQ